MLTTTPAATITVTCPRPGPALLTLGGQVDVAAPERLDDDSCEAGSSPEVIVAVVEVFPSPPPVLSTSQDAPHRDPAAQQPSSPAAIIKEVVMDFSHPPSHRAQRTDAEIDAAVGAFIAELTGTRQPVGAAARCYEHAVETIAEEVTELLATLADRR